MPTLAAMAGVSPPDGRPGRDASPFLLGRDAEARDEVFFEYAEKKSSRIRVSLSPSTIGVGQLTRVEAKLTDWWTFDLAGKRVEFYVDGVFQYWDETDKDGIAFMHYQGRLRGDATVTAVFPEYDAPMAKPIAEISSSA